MLGAWFIKGDTVPAQFKIKIKTFSPKQMFSVLQVDCGQTLRKRRGLKQDLHLSWKGPIMKTDLLQVFI